MSNARGSTGGAGGQGFGGTPGFGDRRRRGPQRRNGWPALWRSPLGAVAVAIAATGYWSTVAWLVASRTTSDLIEVENIGLVDEADLTPNDGTGRLGPETDDQTGRPDTVPAFPRSRIFDGRERPPNVPGYRHFSLGVRELGLADSLPDMILLDQRR